MRGVTYVVNALGVNADSKEALIKVDFAVTNK